jgi:hypothetical protein
LWQSREEILQAVDTENGASEGIRTLDVHLGKVMLYQTELRSLPNRLEKTKGIYLNCKPSFTGLTDASNRIGPDQSQKTCLR